MNLKKSIFSYIIITAFAIFCGLCIFFALETAGFNKMFDLPFPALIGVMCAYLLIIATVYIVLRSLFIQIEKHIKNRKRAEAVFSIVIPVLAILGVLAYLVFYLMYHIPIELRDDTFYTSALISEGREVPFSVHGASYLYTCLLHAIFLIFGNTPFAGIVLQIVLFIICLLLLYFGIQAYAGTIPAAVSIAAFGLFPVSIEYIFSLTPELFYLSLYLFGFYLSGILYKKLCRSGITSAWQYLFLLFVGLYIGFLVYLELYSVALYLFFAMLYTTDKGKRAQALRANGVLLLGGIGGFFLSVSAVVSVAGDFSEQGNSAVNFTAFVQQLPAFYFKKINPSLNNLFQQFNSFDQLSFIVFTALISLAFFIVPAFFLYRGKTCSAFILYLFLLYGLSYFGLTELQVRMGEILGWCMLAGLGIDGIFRVSEKSASENLMADGKQEQEKPAPGEPLHNPLPVPKRKSRTQADFAHQVAEADMKFDIETADDDDFDV